MPHLKNQDAAQSLRSQLATSANALREITMKYEHLKADHSREMEHSQVAFYCVAHPLQSLTLRMQDIFCEN